MTGFSPAKKRAWRNWSLVLFAAFAASAGIWWWHGQRQLQAHWQAAQAALDRHDCWRAQEELQPCLRGWGNRLEVRLLAARAARLADALDEAEDHLTQCERLIETEPDGTDEVRFERKLLQMQQGDLKSREAQWQQYGSLGDTRQVELLDALARGFAETHHFGDAMGCLDQIAQRDPDNVSMLLLRGQLQLRYKRYEGAQLFLEKVVAAAQREQNLAAVAHLDLLQERHPDHAEVLFALGRC